MPVIYLMDFKFERLYNLIVESALPATIVYPSGLKSIEKMV